MKSPTSYSQEDLDLINSEIQNFNCSITTNSSEVPAQKSTINADTFFTNVEGFQNNLNPLNIDSLKNVCNLDLFKENSVSVKSEFIENENVPVTVNSATEVDELPMTVENPATDFHQEVDNIRLHSENKIEKVDELKTKAVNRNDLNFFPGDKLEAKDFNEKWYSARVVETDWVEREVLIHFDKWSSRFDEWIPMDSPRLRMLQIQSREMKPKDFAVGERILATWADGRKYPAKVNAILGNDRYDVLFDDGYAKIVRSSKMTKIEGTPDEKIDSAGYIGSKQERRDRYRKHKVTELFQRKTKKHNSEKLVKKGRHAKDEGTSEVQLDSGSLSGSYEDSSTEVLHGFENSSPKIKTYSKKDKKEKSEPVLDDNIRSDLIDGEPQAAESSTEGPPRSVGISDTTLPTGWQKHFTQRKSGSSAGKWDVLFMHESSGKKFRSRNDIRAFMESQGQFDFDPENFDFCIHRKKKNKLEKPKSEADPVKKPRFSSRTKQVLVTDVSAIPSFNTPSSLMTPSSSIEEGTVFIGGLRIEMEDNSYKCPKEGCLKNFRKENLLQMHIKHYHPEYSKFLGSTPNVADLAYARTIGESIDDIVPKHAHSFIEKNKFERRKGSHDKSQLPVLQSALSPSQLISSSMPSPTPPVLEVEVGRPEDLSDFIRDEKLELGSPIRGTNDNTRQENDCAMSPGTLFDMKLREEKTQTGIKTLLPVRPANPDQRPDRSKSLDESTHKEKGKSQRKRNLSEYHSDSVGRARKKQSAQDHSVNLDDLDDSTLDAEGPAAPTYRFSRRKSDAKNDESNDKSEGTFMMINGEMIKVEQLRREEIINCTCGFMEEDGLMIQCDLCLCWQHGHCNAIEREKDVPEKYVCYICRYPYRQRPSKKYIHNQEFMKEGKLPSLPDRTKNELIINQRTAMLKRSYDLVASLLHIQDVLHSLRVKINVAQKKDHPKLYLWAKNWEKSVVPKPNTTPIPVFEVVQPTDETESRASNETEAREEDETIKEDSEGKSIATDFELVKILEDGGTHSEESKEVNKNEGIGSQEENRLLLDALSKSDNLDENLKTNTLNEVLNSQDVMKEQTEQSKSDILTETGISVQPELSTPQTKRGVALPLQPFIPEPEAPIDPTECRMRLLEHIDHFQSYIASRLTTIEAQVQVLEEMDSDSVPDLEIQPRTKQTVQMLLRDLSTIRKLAALC